MSETVKRDYRDTLNLPKTVFPMKAELPKREPDRVAWWRERGTYERRLERNAEGGPWILHDGPPYANGEFHMGHFLNMVLKDMFVKIALLDGKYAKFVPGWDMHGLPIELETLKHLGIQDFHTIDPLELREKCRERALYWLDRQRESRVRMGNFGLWEHPYRTIDPSFEATIVEALAELAEKQQLYKGLRSTLWCVHDETALAEAEIEYEQKKSRAVYVRFRASEEQAPRILSVATAGERVDGSLQGLPLERPHLDDDAVDASRQRRDRAARRRHVRALPRRRRTSHARRGARGQSARRALRRRGARCVASPATSSTVWRCATRSWIAIRRSFSPTTSISKPEPAPCTRRPDTAPTTSRPA